MWKTHYPFLHDWSHVGAWSAGQNYLFLMVREVCKWWCDQKNGQQTLVWKIRGANHMYQCCYIYTWILHIRVCPTTYYVTKLQSDRHQWNYCHVFVWNKHIQMWVVPRLNISGSETNHGRWEKTALWHQWLIMIVSNLGNHSFGICYVKKTFPKGVENNSLNASFQPGRLWSLVADGEVLTRDHSVTGESLWSLEKSPKMRWISPLL